MDTSRVQGQTVRRALVVGVLSIATVLAVAAVARASIPDFDGVIHGCYKTSKPSKGTVIVIDSNTGQTCPSGFAPLNWSQTGPRGPAGPAPTSTTTSQVRHYEVPTGCDGRSAYCLNDGPFVQVACPVDHHAINGGVLKAKPDPSYPGPGIGDTQAITRLNIEPVSDAVLGLPRPVDNDSAWRMSVVVAFPFTGSAPDRIWYPVDVTLFVICI